MPDGEVNKERDLDDDNAADGEKTKEKSMEPGVHQMKVRPRPRECEIGRKCGRRRGGGCGRFERSGVDAKRLGLCGFGWMDDDARCEIFERGLCVCRSGFDW